MPSNPDDGSGPLDVDAAFAEIVAHWGDAAAGEGPAGPEAPSDGTAPPPRTGASGPGDAPPLADSARTVRPARPLPPAPREDVPQVPPARDEVAEGTALGHDSALGQDARLDEDMALAGLDDRFVPPDPQPLPRDVVGWCAWIAVIGAPLFLLVVALVWREVPALVTAATAVAFVAGFAILVVRLPSSRDDDSDDGAVV